MTCDLPRKRLTLLGGPRGTGKTRMMLTVAGGIVQHTGRPVIYFASDGQSIGELRANAEELGLAEELRLIALVEGPHLETLAEVARDIHPILMIVDALKPSHIHGERCKADSPAERFALELLLGADPHVAGGLSDECDSAIVAMLHMQSDQRDYSVGGQVQQRCSVIVRVDPLETKEHEPPKIRLSVHGKNRFQRGRRRTALLTLTEPDGRLEPHPEDKP